MHNNLIKIIRYTSILLLGILFSACSYSQTKYTVIQEGTKDGVLHESGYITVKPIYNHIFNFAGYDEFFNHPHLINLHWIHNDESNAYAVVQNIDGNYGVINPKGKLLLKPVYDSITYFFNGFMRIEVGNKFGLVDKNFKIVLKPTYDYIEEFVGNIAILQHKNKYGCINRDMELKIKPTYDRIYFQQEDFLRTTLNSKWGYLDNNCNVLSKAIYDYGYDFSNGYAKILLDDKIGYLKEDGTLLQKQVLTDESSSF